MLTVKGCVAVTPWESVASTVNEKFPGAEGVPETVPFDVPSERPVGRAPFEIDHAMAPVPPVDWMVWL